jgi:hypothetical protein
VADPLSPIVLDGVLSDEKLANLLALGTEYAELDFKATIDLSDKRQELELVRDVAGMQARGGYILYGIGDNGKPTGALDDHPDPKLFDDARMVPKLLKWLPEPLRLVTRVTEREGHRVLMLYVERHPTGCVFMEKDGSYTQDGETKFVFRQGDAYWRDGSRTVLIGQRGLEQVIVRRIEDAKASWMDEQREVRRREQAEFEAASKSGGPLGSVNLDLEQADLNAATLELVRSDDDIALRHLLNEARSRAAVLIGRGEVDAQLEDLLDRLACLAATFLVYRQAEPFGRIIELFARIYSMPLKEGDAQRFGHGTQFHPDEVAPRVWLRLVERLYGLGALAVREEDWDAVRTLTSQAPKGLLDYDKNWLRHALTIASRAQHLKEQKNGQAIELSLLSLAQAIVRALDCLRSDGITADDDSILTSLAQFDILSNIVAIDGAGTLGGGVFFTSFARFRQERVNPVVEQLLTDKGMREALFRRDDDDLAIALRAIGDQARQVGFVVDGFRSWDHTPVARFLAEHPPPGAP